MNILTSAYQLDITNLSDIPTDRLWDELETCAALQAQQLVYFAAIYCELDRRNEDMSSFRGGYYAYLSRIAAGTLLPEVIDRFLGLPVCSRLASLSLVQQKQLMKDGATLPLAVFHNGEFTHRKLPVAELVPSQVAQIFGKSPAGYYVRSLPEQTRLLQGPQSPLAKNRKPKKKERIHIDVASGIVTFAVRSVTLKELCSALKSVGVVEL